MEELKNGGILNKGKPLDEKPKQKTNMDSVFEIGSKEREKTIERMKDAVKKERPEEQQVKKLNQQLSGQVSESSKIEKELQDMEQYTEEDLRLAEELLFNGFAQKDIRLTEKTTATVYSINANEMQLINEMMFEFTKQYELADGKLDVSQRTMDLMNQLYVLSLSFKGYNGNDIVPVKAGSLDLIKSAFKRMAETEIAGQIEIFDKLREEIKIVVKKRAAEIKKLPASIIDVLSSKRYEFENTMYAIVNRGDILPKS